MNRTKSQIGKKSRAAGKLFELKVRHNLEERNWIVTKWENQVDFEKNKIIPAKKIFNPFTKSLSSGNGFPDFEARCFIKDKWVVIAVESKMSKYLDQKEKDLFNWYIEHKVFDHFIIAYKNKLNHLVYKNYITCGEEYEEINEAVGY